MVVGTYDVTTARVRLANAGHEPSLLHLPGGEFETFPAEAPPVGISVGVVGDGPFPESEIALGNGTLYVCTDGLTEARTADGNLLGTEGLKRLIAAAGAADPADRLQEIVRHVARQPLPDDLTLLTVDGRSGEHEQGASLSARR
jgi:sigma-B regulation protein RsbU (phosphoserine phosphatase)